MYITDVSSIDEYWAKLEKALPEFSPEEQRAAVTLYRELAKGEPVSAEGLARALDVSVGRARAMLERDSIRAFIYPDDRGRVLGFGGLAAAPMHHRFEVDGRSLWTWCAWDSLFIPEILGRTARVESPDPETGDPVRLTVSPARIEAVEPSEALVSFRVLDAVDLGVSAGNAMASFCQFVFFFGCRETGERWVEKHPGTFLCSLRDAFELAKRLNARNFGLALQPEGSRSVS